MLGTLARFIPSLFLSIPYLQMLVVAGGFDFPWGDSLNSLFSAFSIFFLNFDLTMHACNLKLNYEKVWVFYALFPELWCLCHVARFVVQYAATRLLLLILGGDLLKCPRFIRPFLIEPGSESEWFGQLFDDTLGMFLTAWGPSVAKCFSTFACMRFPGTLQDEFPSGYLVNNPTMLCYRGNHWVLVIVAVLSLSMNFVVVPVYIGWSMFKIGPEGRLLSKPFQRRFGKRGVWMNVCMRAKLALCRFHVPEL